MTFQDKPTFENVHSGNFNSRLLREIHCVFERGLVLKCHILDSRAETRRFQRGFQLAPPHLERESGLLQDVTELVSRLEEELVLFSRGPRDLKLLGLGRLHRAPIEHLEVMRQLVETRVVAAQVEFTTKILKQFLIFLFQALGSRRFHRGFDGVNLHRPTE